MEDHIFYSVNKSFLHDIYFLHDIGITLMQVDRAITKDSLVKRQGLFNQTEVENYEKNTLECTYFLAIPTIDSYNIIKLLHMCISGSRVDYKEVIACDMGLYQ